MQITGEDIRIELEILKKLIDRKAEKEKIKSEQLKINDMLEQYLEDMK